MKDGGPAYPQPFIYEPSKGASGVYTSAQDTGNGGMTLLEHYAGEALKAVILNGIQCKVEDAAKRLGIPPQCYMSERDYPRLCAKEAWDIAEAMIAEREKRLA